MKKIILIFILAIPDFLYGETAYVTVSGSGNKDGSSWANAYDGNNLQKAIFYRWDTIFVARGIYKPTNIPPEANGASSNHMSFYMNNNVVIFGGFTGTEKFYFERTDYWVGGINETVLSGDISRDGIELHCFHVFNNRFINESAVLDGFTISGGNAACLPDQNGGGMLNYKSSPTLRNITFKDNYAYGSGGGIFNGSESSPKLLNVIFYKNRAGKGGGIANCRTATGMFGNMDGEANPVLYNVTFSLNSASEGGSIYNSVSSNCTLNNCIIWGNAPDTSQIFLDNGTLTLNNCCFSQFSVISKGKSIAGSLNIHSNPLFVNPSLYDFRIMGHSPCVNSGNNVYVKSYRDFRWKLRIQHNTVDMGAYEYTDYVDPIKGPFYVSSSGDDQFLGTSWARPKRTLQAALNLVRIPGHQEEIWVRYGIYYPTQLYGTNMGRHNAFQLHNNLAIYGGFFGNETSLDQRKYYGHGEPLATILSGDIGVPGEIADNCYHVFFNPSPTFWGQWPANPNYGDKLDSTAILDGFIITGGNANSSSGV